MLFCSVLLHLVVQIDLGAFMWRRWNASFTHHEDDPEDIVNYRYPPCDAPFRYCSGSALKRSLNTLITTSSLHSIPSSGSSSGLNFAVVAGELLIPTPTSWTLLYIQRLLLHKASGEIHRFPLLTAKRLIMNNESCFSPHLYAFILNVFLPDAIY